MWKPPSLGGANISAVWPPAVMSVRARGMMTLLVMPYLSRSCAALMAMAMMPAFAAA